MYATSDLTNTVIQRISTGAAAPELPRRAFIRAAGAASLGLLLPAASRSAERYPQKAIKIVVAYTPGGDTGIVADAFSKYLAKKLGVPSFVEYKPGATGFIGTNDVIHSDPDGYTLLVAPNSVAIAPHLIKSYDVVHGLTPIARLIDQPIIVVVNTKFGINSIKELVARAKEGKLAGFASPGHGSTMHIMGELFNKVAGMNLQEIPYKGTMPAITDLVGGQVPLMYTTLHPVRQFLQSGQLKALAITSARRASFLPDVPTFAEVGYPQVDIDTWQALFGPANLPREIVNRLNAEANAYLADRETWVQLEGWAMDPAGGVPRSSCASGWGATMPATAA